MGLLLHPTSAWRPAFTPPAGQAGSAGLAGVCRSRGKPRALWGGGVFGLVRFVAVARLPLYLFLGAGVVCPASVLRWLRCSHRKRLRGMLGFGSRFGLAQQAGQRDVPPGGGFRALVFIKVWWLRLAFVGGTPLTVTLGGLVLGMSGLGCLGRKQVVAERQWVVFTCFFCGLVLSPLSKFYGLCWLVVFAGVLWGIAAAVLSRRVSTVFSGSRPHQSFVACWLAAFVCILWVVGCGNGGFPILHGRSGRFPFRRIVGLSSGRLAHKLPAAGFVSSAFHLQVLVFVFLLSAPCFIAFFGWLGRPFSGCCECFRAGYGLAFLGGVAA